MIDVWCNSSINPFCKNFKDAFEGDFRLNTQQIPKFCINPSSNTFNGFCASLFVCFITEIRFRMHSSNKNVSGLVFVFLLHNCSFNKPTIYDRITWRIEFNSNYYYSNTYTEKNILTAITFYVFNKWGIKREAKNTKTFHLRRMFMQWINNNIL